MRGTQVLGQGTQVSGQGAQVSGQGAQEPGYSMLPSTAYHFYLYPCLHQSLDTRDELEV